MAKQKADQYANVAYGRITMSAIDTLSFEPIRFAVGIFQGVALVLHRLLWYPWDATIRELGAATDKLEMALTTSNKLTSIGDITDPAIVDRRAMLGMGAAIEPITIPLTTSWEHLPMGGKILTPNPLFVALMSAGFVAAGSASVQLDFTFVELTDADYIELMQSQLPANI